MDVFDLADAHAHSARAFGAVADLYNKIRPPYPLEAVRWLLGDRPKRVLDLGAGAGIFSRALASAGHEVIAIEPDPLMRRLVGEGITAIDGTAEEIPFPDASVDAVVAAQSYHWFNAHFAHAEIARVLADDGIFGPIWNIRDESVDWVAIMSKIAESEAQDALYPPLNFGSVFTKGERHEFRHVTHHTADSLIDLVRSRSYYLMASSERRVEVEAELRDLVAPLGEPFELPYITVAVRGHRLPR